MKKVAFSPEPPSPEFNEAVENLVAAFGEIELIEGRAAEKLIADRDERERERIEQITNLIVFAKKLMEYEKVRTFHIAICGGCSNPMMVTAGARGWKGKSTRHGGCVTCFGSTGQGGDSKQMQYAVWLLEVER